MGQDRRDVSGGKGNVASRHSCNDRLARYGARSTGRVSGDKGKVASALVQRPSVDMDNKKTGRYFAHKLRTAAC